MRLQVSTAQLRLQFCNVLQRCVERLIVNVL